MADRPPLPPFDRETAGPRSRPPRTPGTPATRQKVALAYTEDSVWRNRDTFVTGRAAIVEFLTAKWERELDYALRKDLWAFDGNRIAVRFQYEWHDADGPVVALLRQRAVGVRRARPDAPPRGQHQRRTRSRSPSAASSAAPGSRTRWH